MALILICLIQIVFVHLPIKIFQYFKQLGDRGTKAICLMKCFGGGIFLGIYLLHMAPEVRQLLEQSMLIPYNMTYPIPELITGLGFFMVLFIEYAVVSTQSRLDSADEIQQDLNTPNESQKDEKAVDEHTTTSKNENSSLSNLQFRSIFFQVALSLHVIFEGMSVGLKRSHREVWILTGAICIHEVVVAFCLGVNLYRSFSKNLQKYIMFGVFYAVDSAIGIAIGTAVTSVNGHQYTIDLINGILQGLASGIFIYVTFFEILQGSLTYNSPLSHLIVTIIGFGVMAGINAIPDISL
ncbi:unnamed protein product [Dimorphilus gyrociliatus]|uniref:Uncharacterized protein n=1 Tax=Dimorphilus gyrociliatus TaxID=2664684 RepID=A0A7I8WBS3_9ANNE|nr:unnamed protein product [Dimorphilus gyrociliatus]